MKAKIITLWANMVESFWLVPALMAVSAMVVAVGLVWLDGNVQLDLSASSWLWSGGAGGARTLLSTVATSMMTVAGTVFSITIAALTLASQQFGPRLLRNFTTDRGNQIVLGTFVATFLYCLMVLRSVRGPDEGQFVPNLAVSFGVVLACASIGVLIFFIHHLSNSIQAEKLLALVGRDLKADLRRLSPPAPPGPGDAERRPTIPAAEPEQVGPDDSGYIDAIDRDGIVAFAEEHGLLIRLRHRPGDYLSSGEPVFDIWGAADGVDESMAKRICNMVQLGSRRTPLQDVRYGVRQLNEIGARALSPGINDPFTAMGCVDWLTDALAGLCRQEDPSGLRCNEDGVPRLIEHPVGFADLVRLSYDPIRAYGSSSVLVSVHLLDALATLAARAERPEQRQAVLYEAQITLRSAQQALASELDRERVASAFNGVREKLNLTGSSATERDPTQGVRLTKEDNDHDRA